MAKNVQSAERVEHADDSVQHQTVNFPHANYVLTPVFSSRESMERAKEFLRKRQQRRSFGWL